MTELKVSFEPLLLINGGCLQCVHLNVGVDIRCVLNVRSGKVSVCLGTFCHNISRQDCVIWGNASAHMSWTSTSDDAVQRYVDRVVYRWAKCSICSNNAYGHDLTFKVVTWWTNCKRRTHQCLRKSLPAHVVLLPVWSKSSPSAVC